jgi:hypothetical protein
MYQNIAKIWDDTTEDSIKLDAIIGTLLDTEWL